MKFFRVIITIFSISAAISASVTINTGTKVYLKSGGEMTYNGDWICYGLFYPSVNSLVSTVQFVGTTEFTNSILGINISANLSNNLGNVTTSTEWNAITANGNTGIACHWDISSSYAPSGRNLTLSWNTSFDNGLTGSVCVYKSSDGGVTWQSVTSPVPISSLGSPIRYITVSGVSSFSKWTVGSIGDESLPVELMHFIAEYINGCIELKWRTESEIENLGFIIERSECKIFEKKTDEILWIEIAHYSSFENLKGQGNTSRATDYQFTDRTIQPGITYYYRLSDVSYETIITVIDTVSITVPNSPEYQLLTPDSYCLNSVYPNPFNLETELSYQLPKESEVTLEIYDLKGRLVSNLIHLYQNAGYYSVNWNPRDICSGLYIVRLEAGDFVSIRKCTLIK